MNRDTAMLSEVLLLLIILTKQGEKYVLTQIMPFIEPHRHERHHSSKLLAWSVIIVTNDTDNKHVKGDERVSHDTLQNSYDEHVDNSTPFYC